MLSGRIRASHSPGLKPWAVLSSRFRLRPISPFSYVGQIAAKSDKSLWDKSANCRALGLVKAARLILRAAYHHGFHGPQ
jgi:hypothetical protein